MLGYEPTPSRLLVTEASSPRLVLCETCGSEGRILSDHGNDPSPDDCGECPYCEGTGGELVGTLPIEADDLDACAPPIGAA